MVFINKLTNFDEYQRVIYNNACDENGLYEIS